ncbi:RNA polymerase sigma-70 factor [Terrimonas pollutisoli]|uniref:RNA polymerase sigma-70 factor n=1 Tax=Terrimonas pollutisoli TaxID=3034147 RepID=UPI0023EBD3FD|nr:RNA polymerase sigma-70 factor [Terrimonas sp. H1YJ31]
MPANDHDITVQLRELQKKIANDDQTAFTQLYLHFGKKLIHFATSLVRSKEIAEELVEDVFVKLWANRRHITEIENITVYIYIATKNKALNSLSQKAKELILAPFDFLDSSVNDFASDPYELMITSEMMDRMHQAVDALPPRCKMIFKLIREDGLKYKEVAEILNISVNTIDVQMAIAVKKICTSLHISKPGESSSASTPGQKNLKKNQERLSR